MNSSILPMFYYANVGRTGFLNVVLGGLREQRPTTVFHNSLFSMVRTLSKYANAEAADHRVVKRIPSPKITLVENQSLITMSMDAAQLLAKRRSMNLIKVREVDRKNDRPIYKLISSVKNLATSLDDLQSYGETSAPLSSRKNQKVLNIGARIEEHDLMARIKQIVRWLHKHHEVRIMINGVGEGDIERSEKIYRQIELGLMDMRDSPKIVQLKQKGSLIKFNILPSVLANAQARGE